MSDTQLGLEKHLMSGTMKCWPVFLEMQGEDKSTKFIWPCASITSDKQLTGNCNIYKYINSISHFGHALTKCEQWQQNTIQENNLA